MQRLPPQPPASLLSGADAVGVWGLSPPSVPRPFPNAILCRAALLGIEFGEVGEACRHVKTPKKCGCPTSRFLVLFARVLRVVFTLRAAARKQRKLN
jgi:hypothetical protein